MNELGPTIQQGVIQRPVGGTELNKEPRPQVETRVEPRNGRKDDTNVVPGLEENTRISARHHNTKIFPEGYQLALNEAARPVFMNHYYAGEAVVSGTNKRYIRLEDRDVLSESKQQTQAVNCESTEHSRKSLAVRCPPIKMANTATTSVERSTSLNVGFHGEFPEQSQNSLKDAVQKNTDHTQASGIHSEYRESSRHSPDTMNIGKSRVQAASRMDPNHVPLTGYEQYHQEVRTYPVNREPLNVQPTTTNDNSVLLDLPNVQTGLPMPLTPQQVNQPVVTQREGRINDPSPTEIGSVTNTQILESIQNITKVMQQQLIFNGKTTEAGILQTASLFQEMIKAQEKRDLDPALMAIPTFLGQVTDRPQCLDWLSRVKNVCDQSGRSFRQELINKSGILVQNFIRSLSDQITNKELTENILQFFSDIPTTSHALNKLRLIKQELDEPIVNYNQRYQNLVERVEGCQLNSITSTVAMELYLGSIIEPIRKSIRNALYFNSKHAPKTLGEAMQKAQDLHIKHLYASGEDQQEILTTNSQEVMPEITVNEANIRENKGWYLNNREFREHSQDSREMQRQPNSYIRQRNFGQSSTNRSTMSSENSESSRNSRSAEQYAEGEPPKEVQQPSLLRGSFTQIMVNPIQLQDHEFTAWLDRLVEARKNRQEKHQRPYRTYRKPYNEQRQQGKKWNKPQLKNKLKPAQELEVKQIMENFNCEYNDVVEAVDLYNLDVEECATA